MGDQDKEKKMGNPDVVHKVCDWSWLHQTELTIHVIAPWLCSVPKSHPVLLICSYEDQEVRGPRGTRPKRYEDQEVGSDPYGSVYDLLSQDKYTICVSQGMSRKDTVDKFISFMIMLTEKLRMVLVKLRSREGSASEGAVKARPVRGCVTC
ncbi:hypothetical protein IGI04_036115, partial [Brassica rapa subsp. trilocularis]